MSKVMSLRTVADVIRGYNIPNEASRIKKIKSDLIGTTIYTRYLNFNILLTFFSYNNMCYTIENVDFNKTPQNTFPFAAVRGDTEKPISYIDYYKKIKKVDIRDRNQPLLRTTGRGKQAIYLIPELCLLSDMFVSKDT